VGDGIGGRGIGREVGVEVDFEVIQLVEAMIRKISMNRTATLFVY
jgi:hypothetical protein